ncbi:hypothetical protein [Thermobispora bispora]|uniref:hypothetical protein n=1 Tax=Thermobispora bispora TaxID=2006 RepID=UPI00197E2A46|nr:hypothetical protein [Thermobispora bispora]QSI46656.1 hypothetical protein CYL17_01350 [Thermobispora bispora]
MRRLTLLIAGTACAAAFHVQPANAEDTVVTFTVTAGPLSVTVPASASIGAGEPGTTISGSLGTITVTDSRGANPAEWTVTVSSTDFTAAGVPAIPASAATYTAGAPTSAEGDGVFSPGAPGPLGTTPMVAFTHTGGTGGNSASWEPALSVNVPNTATAVTYTATVTHLVA